MTNQKNRNAPEEKRDARERLRRRREREKAAEKRAKALKTAVAVLAVLGVVGLVGAVAANRVGAGGTGGAGGDVRAEPIVDGDPRAPVTLTVYEDFRCPGCGHFENGFRETVRRLQDTGRMKVEYHLVTIIDGNVGGRGSTYAANAAACARDRGRFREYHGALFAHQPEEVDDAFGDKDRLLELAEGIEGLSGPEFTRCVREEEHREWVERSTEAFLRSGHDSTPTVLLNGEDLHGDPSAPLTPEKLEEKVEAAARKA
ncbi:DsbA family protein [Streptomyces megasporus]|uniref:DsbA family protein n=1 Tax=Streptomyces megasporus TaxID=44060 RepID=UPI0004E20F9E|nr:thioredoxin domain-containing protein [Streptomyces megasporus]